MARVFVTGSADGLGKMAAELLIEQGHEVVLHSRSDARADETRKKIAGAEEDSGRPASTLRCEYSRSVHPNGSHHDAETTGVPVLRNALRLRIASRRHAMGKAAMERLPTPKPSFRMCFWHSRWRDCFPG